MSDKTPPRGLPGDVPDHHAQLATRLRALAADATTASVNASVKALLLEEAKREERIAGLS